MSDNSGTVRYPRLQILLNGAALPGAISANVSQNNYFQADVFQAQFALPTESYPFPNTLPWWGSQDTIRLEVQASLDGGSSWTSLILGNVDSIDSNVISGIVQVKGRDLTSLLIDTKTRQTYQNKTASQIATMLAQEHGLTPDVTATNTLVGRYYEQDHDRITAGQFSYTTNEWDLLVNVAQHEGFDVWVDGTTLHFHPAQTLSTSAAETFVFDASEPYGNVKSMTLSRSLTLAKDVFVSVRSWDSRNAKGFTVYAGSQSPTAQEFTFTRPNLTPAEAQTLANNIRADITKHERKVTVVLPADLTSKPRDGMQITGTNSSWDQLYWIESIERSLSFGRGFTMTVQGKNHSPETTLVL